VATLAKQERVRLNERTKAGMARRKAAGAKMEPPSLAQEQVEQVRRRKAAGMTNYTIAKALKLSQTTVAKYLSWLIC